MFVSRPVPTHQPGPPPGRERVVPLGFGRLRGLPVLSATAAELHAERRPLPPGASTGTASAERALHLPSRPDNRCRTAIPCRWLRPNTLRPDPPPPHQDLHACSSPMRPALAARPQRCSCCFGNPSKPHAKKTNCHSPWWGSRNTSPPPRRPSAGDNAATLSSCSGNLRIAEDWY